MIKKRSNRIKLVILALIASSVKLAFSFLFTSSIISSSGVLFLVNLYEILVTLKKLRTVFDLKYFLRSIGTVIDTGLFFSLILKISSILLITKLINRPVIVVLYWWAISSILDVLVEPVIILSLWLLWRRTKRGYWCRGYDLFMGWR